MSVATPEGPDRPKHEPIRSSARVRHPSDIKRDLVETSQMKLGLTRQIEDLVDELSESIKVYPA